jgi:hypothetical protein
LPKNKIRILKWKAIVWDCLKCWFIYWFGGVLGGRNGLFWIIGTNVLYLLFLIKRNEI